MANDFRERIIWAAGLFEGEGSVAAYKRKRGNKNGGFRAA